jgi:hypothetical protein
MFVYSSRDVLIEDTGTSVLQLRSYTATKLQSYKATYLPTLLYHSNTSTDYDP